MFANNIIISSLTVNILILLHMNHCTLTVYSTYVLFLPEGNILLRPNTHLSIDVNLMCFSCMTSNQFCDATSPSLHIASVHSTQIQYSVLLYLCDNALYKFSAIFLPV